MLKATGVKTGPAGLLLESMAADGCCCCGSSVLRRRGVDVTAGGPGKAMPEEKKREDEKSCPCAMDTHVTKPTSTTDSLIVNNNARLLHGAERECLIYTHSLTHLRVLAKAKKPSSIMA